MQQNTTGDGLIFCNMGCYVRCGQYSVWGNKNAINEFISCKKKSLDAIVFLNFLEYGTFTVISVEYYYCDYEKYYFLW